jgi:hypothetical protein
MLKKWIKALRMIAHALLPAIIVALFLASGCGEKKENSGQDDSKATITSVTLAKDVQNKQPVGVTDTFALGDTINAIVSIDQARAKSLVIGKWSYQDSMLIHTDTSELQEGMNLVRFLIAKEGDWPEGPYKLDLAIGNNPPTTERFFVAKPAVVVDTVAKDTVKPKAIPPKPLVKKKAPVKKKAVVRKAPVKKAPVKKATTTRKRR